MLGAAIGSPLWAMLLGGVLAGIVISAAALIED
jgi:hypothetical protein